MTPVIAHLRNILPELPLTRQADSLLWVYDKPLTAVSSAAYSKIVLLLPLLTMEFNILCNQINHNLTYPAGVSTEEMTQRLNAALLLTQLLEYIHLHYLTVPREQVRFHQQFEIFNSLFNEFNPPIVLLTSIPKKLLKSRVSLSHEIRTKTAAVNWYRLVFTRCKRVLNFLDLVVTGSPTLRTVVKVVDKYTNPAFAFLSWTYFVPRLGINLFVLFKHMIPGFWMNAEEKQLQWFIRTGAQIQRRWFELANDSVWFTVGLLNCFILTGVLAPLAIYVTISAFAYDVLISGIRAYVELKRLSNILAGYSNLLSGNDDRENTNDILDYERFIKHRIEFEKLRLSLHFTGTTAIFFAMCFALPSLAINPVFPLIGAVFLLMIWAVTFTLTIKLEQYRPKESVDKPINFNKNSFFAKAKPLNDQPLPPDEFDAGLAIP
ncbi:MAG TPA: hypothetical protein PK657_04390 [Legionella sp.]|nr:hypothetical protein [Legionella sp.]